MQTALTYRMNRDLFSNYYLNEHLPETEAWDEMDDDELREAKADIMELWEREKETAPKRNESQLEEKFIRPMFRKLGIPFEVEESTSRTQRRPDYGFFESEDAARGAFERREEGSDFYKNAVAVADAKRWGRPLDTRGSGEHERDFENPSYQIHVYLQETPAQWAVLTNGKKWRLYYGPTSHRLDSYFEIDLPTILEQGDLEDFKYFYLFFRHSAFVEDSSGECFLDEVYDESNVFAQDLGADLQDNIYEAIKVLSEGFLQYPENDLDRTALCDDYELLDSPEDFEDARLDLIHDSSLIYLYRLIFVLYAEAEGRKLLDTSNEIYEESYSLNTLKQEIADELDSGDPSYQNWQDSLQARLDELFALIDKGSKSRGIPEDDLYIPAYNGGLFRTDPEEDDGREARFLAAYGVGDEYLARVVDLLARSENDDGEGMIFVDYSSLDVRHLGSIYEGLLEYQLHVADEPLTLDGSEYVPADEGEDVAVKPGEVYLTTDSGERKTTGSYYTPEYVVEYIVDETLDPLVSDIYEDLLARDPFGKKGGGAFAQDFAERVFDLKILDPAMGSGHFLTNAVDYLARRIIEAQERQAAQEGVESVDEDHDINWARRKVAQRCIYGVDVNPLATELAKVSLWLRTLAAEQPLAFLDHHLKAGNSLVGSDIEEVLDQGDTGMGNDGQLTLQQSFDHTRQQALEHVMERFTDLLSIDNETLTDIKRMEDAYEDVREDDLYQRLLAMANVHTASAFGLNVPENAEKQMAEALRDDIWGQIEDEDWFVSAQAMADNEQFFHWELEFPVAFYGEDGERLEDSGFDAVIGNPPWVSNWELTESDPDLPDRLESLYPEVTSGHWDLYILFGYRSIQLTKREGTHSFITPTSLGYEKYGSKLREIMITECRLNQIVSFGETTVFPEVDRQCMIYILQPRQDPGTTSIVSWNGSGFVKGPEIDQEKFLEFSNNSIRPEVTNKELSIKSKLEESSTPLGRICCVNPGVVAHSASDSSKEFSKNDVIHDHNGGNFNKYIEGSEIERYLKKWNGRYISYSENREHFHRPKFPELFESEKLMFRGISGSNSRILCCPDRDGFYTNHNIVHAVIWNEQIVERKSASDHEIHPNAGRYTIPYLAGIANSTLLTFYFKEFLATGTLQGSYSGMYPGDIRALPICELPTQNDHSEQIENAVDDLIQLKEDRHSLNLTLLDYLGNYAEGQHLPEVGLFQPTSKNVLNATTEEYEKLRVGNVRLHRDDMRVTVEATARYKPEEAQEFEIDQWGYTETDYHEAFTLADLNEEEASLIEAFVPVAVEEADGFAGFRDNATKTNSLLDRLKAITLPTINDVQDDLKRYIETKERAEELDEKIERTDQLIDDIVYELYGLTNEEIEIVESTVQDD